MFDLPVSGLLAASGVIAIVLGLALQSTLGDVFSGIVLNLSRPYRPGDWIILDAGQTGGLEGWVIETNWRATQFLTRSNDVASIPNSIISEVRLVNASAPASVHGVIVTVRLEPTAAPLSSVLVLEIALLSCTRILRTPPPIVMTGSLDAVALAPAVQNEVFDRVYRHCASTGIPGWVIACGRCSGSVLERSPSWRGRTLRSFRTCRAARRELKLASATHHQGVAHAHRRIGPQGLRHRGE